MNVDAIPAELRDLARWVVWRWEPDPEKPDKRKKPPYCPGDPRRHASSTKPETWAPFEQALGVVLTGKADGIGFALAPPYVGVDLDEELPEVDQHVVLLALDSYAERSPSGTGHHVVIRASLNGHGRHPQGIGVFQTDRFFYFTGEHVRGTPVTIEDRQAELEEVLARFLPSPDSEHALRDPQPVDLDDRDLLERAMRARNGADFERLWNGDRSGYASASEADLSLCARLAYWTGRDPDRIDRMFRASGLMREKWERADYRARTIETAIAGCSDTYSGRTSAQKSVESVAKKTDFLRGTDGDGLTDFSLEESVSLSPSPSREEERFVRTSTPSPSPDSERPFALPIADFVALEREQREPLLADTDGRAIVGRHSLTLLGARGGQGKTTWFIDLALHLAAGIDYPPFTVPRPASVLLIENEGPEDLFAEKLKAKLLTFPHELSGRLDICVCDWGGFSLADEALREQLTREIAEKGYDLVFGDPLDSLGIEGVGSPEDTRKFLELMKTTGLNKTVAWWLNTHPRKEKTQEALDEIAGAWGGKPDAVLLMRMLDDDRTQIRFPKLRWAKRGRRPSILLAFDPETEAFTYLGEESEVDRDYRAEIADLLADGKWRVVKEIAAPQDKSGIGASVDTVKKVLEEHPDVFEARTGEAARALNRSLKATVWQLAGGPA
jgi:putative DNA primase/helicase